MAAAAAASEEIEKLNEKLNDLKQDNLTLASQVEMCQPAVTVRPAPN